MLADEPGGLTGSEQRVKLPDGIGTALGGLTAAKSATSAG
jgi:hypothetical protein